MDIEVRGLAELRQKLNQLEQAVEQMKAPAEESLDLLRTRLQQYPAPPAGSKYQRTYDLKNSWQTTVLITGTTTIASISSNVPYAPLVQDEDNQAGIHAGRWPTIQSVLKEEETRTVALYERELDRLIAR